MDGSSTAKSNRSQNTNLILATLTYSYFIEEYRSGTYTHQFSKKSDADEFVSQLKDKHVPIRYNPSKPDESDIEESDINQFVSSLSRIGYGLSCAPIHAALSHGW